MKKFIKAIGYLIIIFGAFLAVYNRFFKPLEDEDETEKEIITYKRDYIDLD